MMPTTASTSARWWTLTVVSVAAFMLMLDITVVNVALPNIRRALGASFPDLQWALDAYALTLAVFLLTAGSLGDIWGRKRVFIAGFAAFSAASLAAGLATTALQLDVARAAQGVGGAILYAVGPALIGHEFRGRERGIAFGVFGGISGLAIAVGPLTGGLLTNSLGWRWIFLVNVPVGAVAVALTWWRMRDSRNPNAMGADWPGLVTFSAALGSLVFALIRGDGMGWSSPAILALFSLAAAGFVGFVFLERARGHLAMLELSMFRNVTFNGVSAVAFLASAAVLPALFFEVSYVQNVRGFSALQTGIRFLPLTLMLFVVAAVVGSLTTRVSARLLLGSSMVFLAVGISLFAFVGEQDAWTAFIPSMLLTGVGMGMSNPVRAATAISVAAPERAGMTSGANETFQQVGVAVGIAALGAFFQHRVAGAFAATPVGNSVGGAAAKSVGKAVAAGNMNAGTTAVPARLAGSAVRAAEHAFYVGLHDVLLVGAGIAAVAAAVAFLAIRTQDLHSSGLSAIPPEVDPPAADSLRLSPSMAGPTR